MPARTKPAILAVAKLSRLSMFVRTVLPLAPSTGRCTQQIISSPAGASTLHPAAFVPPPGISVQRPGSWRRKRCCSGLLLFLRPGGGGRFVAHRVSGGSHGAPAFQPRQGRKKAAPPP